MIITFFKKSSHLHFFYRRGMHTNIEVEDNVSNSTQNTFLSTLKDPIIQQAETKINTKEKSHWKDELKKLEDKVYTNKLPESINTDNDSYEEDKVKEPLYVSPNLTKEAVLTDTTVKSITQQIVVIGEHLDKEIEQTEHLAKEWNLHIKALDKYIKSLSGIPWKKLLTYSACLLTIGAFLYKMGFLRQVPKFFGSAVEHLATSTTSTTITPNTELNIHTSLPSTESVEKGIKAMLDTPLTSTTILVSIGTLSIGLGILRAIVWVIRKAPK